MDLSMNHLVELAKSFVSSSAGAGLLLVVLARLLPNEKVEALGFRLGTLINTVGVGRLGRGTYARAEGFLENSVVAFLDGLHRGLHPPAPAAPPADVPPAPPAAPGA